MSVSIADVRSWLGESTYGLAELSARAPTASRSCSAPPA